MSCPAPRGRGRGACVALLLALGLGPAVAAPAADAADGSAEVAPAVCDRLAASAWPRSPLERRTLLQQLEAALEHCRRHARFLATLGGNWLEEDDPVRALLWLERALLLDPELLGAQADYALALMALGETTARDELLDRWRGRDDVPPLVMARLAQGRTQPAAPRLGRSGEATQGPRWARAGEISVLAGYESNLDQSPRLEEFVITPPGGAIAIPVDQRPRAGAAATAEASWQLGHSPARGWIVQAGAQALGRSSPAEPDTDWRALRLAASLSTRLDGWRLQLLGSTSWTSGPLDDPYRLGRVGIAAEREGRGCSHRLGVDHERRFERRASLDPGRTASISWFSQCLLGPTRDWRLAVTIRHAQDRPVDEQRPGGAQRQWGIGWRLSGPIGGGWNVDLGLRTQWAQDDDGYSPLLENNARRRMRPTQLSVELTHRAGQGLLGDSEWVLQAFAAHQTSNLAVFRYQSAGAYGGMRWRF